MFEWVHVVVILQTLTVPILNVLVVEVDVSYTFKSHHTASSGICYDVDERFEWKLDEMLIVEKSRLTLFLIILIKDYWFSLILHDNDLF